MEGIVVSALIARCVRLEIQNIKKQPVEFMLSLLHLVYWYKLLLQSKGFFLKDLEKCFR